MENTKSFKGFLPGSEELVTVNAPTNTQGPIKPVCLCVTSNTGLELFCEIFEMNGHVYHARTQRKYSGVMHLLEVLRIETPSTISPSQSA